MLQRCKTRRSWSADVGQNQIWAALCYYAKPALSSTPAASAPWVRLPASMGVKFSNPIGRLRVVGEGFS